MKDNETDVQDAPAPVIDPNTPEGRKALELMLEKAMKAEAGDSGEERKGLDVNPDANSPKPVNKGNRVTHWKPRGFRFIQAVAGSNDPDYSKRQLFAKRQADHINEYMTMADSQRQDEENEARAIVKEAFDDNRISGKAQRRILNLLDDPDERAYLSEMRTHSGLTAPSGEFLIPKPMLATIYTIIEEYGLAQRLATNVTLQGPGNSLDLNSIATAPTANWVGENVLFSESDIALGQNVLTVKKIGVVSSITRELQEDQILPLIPSWLEKVGEDIAKKIDQSWLIGDGSSTYGDMVGICNKSSVQSFTAGSGDLAPADIVENDLDQVVRLLTTARRARAQWIMARILWDYVRKFESTVGARIVQQMLQDAARQAYDGFNVNLSEALDNTNGDVANRDFAVLGDFSKSFFGTKRGVTVETSTEGVLSDSSGNVTYNALQQDGMIVKLSLRVGHQVPTAYQDAFAVLNAPAS